MSGLFSTGLEDLWSKDTTGSDVETWGVGSEWAEKENREQPEWSLRFGTDDVLFDTDVSVLLSCDENSTQDIAGACRKDEYLASSHSFSGSLSKILYEDVNLESVDDAHSFAIINDDATSISCDSFNSIRHSIGTDDNDQGDVICSLLTRVIPDTGNDDDNEGYVLSGLTRGLNFEIVTTELPNEILQGRLLCIPHGCLDHDNYTSKDFAIDLEKMGACRKRPLLSNLSFNDSDTRNFEGSGKSAMWVAEANQKYRERREKNNVASRRSRENKKRVLLEMTAEVEMLETDNERLKLEVARLECETRLWKELVLMN